MCGQGGFRFPPTPDRHQLSGVKFRLGSLLLFILVILPVLAVAPEGPPVDAGSGRPWWEYLLRGMAVVGLGYGAWTGWRNRKRP